jgi:hypothetical protein
MRSDHDALTARIRELEAQREWRPIETAPKDGTRIYLWLADEGFEQTATWRNIDDWEGWWLWEWDCGADIHDITHWTPSLMPPIGEVAEGRPAGPSVPDSSVPARTEGDV